MSDNLRGIFFIHTVHLLMIKDCS